jgi:L-arabinonolactonase
MKAELVVDCRNILGECVLWDGAAQRLRWTDIEGKALWTLDPASGDARPTAMPDRVGSFALAGGGRLLLALARGLAFFDPLSGGTSPIAEVEAHLPQTRLNDGRCDREGRFVFGGFDEKGRQPVSAVYQLDEHGRVRTLLSNVAVANSICFSLDGRTMYFADTPQRLILAFDYDSAAARLTNERIFADLHGEPGSADGSVIDADGCLWNAQVRGGRIVRYRPDGWVDRVVEVPVPGVTCVGFGGPALDILYATTMRRGMSADDLARLPEAGGLFAVRPGVRGVPEVAYRAETDGGQAPHPA